MKNSWETITVDNSPMRLYLSQPEGPGPFPAIIVIQNQDGVREFTQEMTRRVAQAGYLASPRSFIIARASPRLRNRPRASRTPAATSTCSTTSMRRSISCAAAPRPTQASLASSASAWAGGSLSSWPRQPSRSKPRSIITAAAFTRNGAIGPRRRELAANVSCPIQGHFGELDKNPPPEEMRRLDAELTTSGQRA